MPARQRPPSAARDLIPDQPELGELRSAAAGCTACDLYRDATQTVFGEGAASSEVMLVGEQPGDGEDRAGRPFVGPAGRMLDQALAEAGIDRELAYVTNVVKHFKFERRGRLRIHKKPNAEQVHACFPWLEAELQVVQPRVLATVHPSSILRAPDEEARTLAYKGFVADLAVVAEELRGPAS